MGKKLHSQNFLPYNMRKQRFATAAIAGVRSWNLQDMVKMYDLETKNITIELSQHEAIVGMKRGSDTIRDVIDRLLERDSVFSIIDGRLESLEMSTIRLVADLHYMEEAVKELKEALNDRQHKD